MKREIFLLLMTAMVMNGLFGQDSAISPKIYRAWIYVNNEPFKIEGSLYQINDSTIAVASFKRMQDYTQNNFEIVVLHIGSIETIKIRRHKSVATGAWLGTISGFTVGFAVGVATAVDFSYLSGTEQGLIIGFPSAFAGAIIGAIGGSLKINIPINKSMDRFNSQRNKLRAYSLTK
jgi:hypothetical protein